MRRRKYLAVSAGMVGLAGCAGDGGDGSEDTTTKTTTSTTTTTSETTTTTTTEDSTTTEEPTTTEETTTEQVQTATVQIGEKVAGDQMSMVVKSLQETDSLGDFQDADSGNVYAVIELEVKNTTQNKYANFSSFLQTQIQDGEGYSYDPELVSGESSFSGGQLAPGEVASGDVAFEIPSDASGLTLLFDFEAFSFFKFHRVTVDLTSEASSIADLQQSLNVPVHEVGKQVTHDDVAVSVNSVEFTNSVGSFSEADEGNEFVIIDVTTANNTDSVVNFSSLLQMGVKDGNGQSYNYSTMATSSLTQSYSGGEVSAGQKTRGKIAFEVPEGISPLYFTFEYSIISGGSKTFWKLR